MLNPTAERVARNTPTEVNEEIRWQTEANISRFSMASPAEIEQRLTELDREWDIERCIETLAPGFTLLGLGLGMTVNRRWLVLPIVVQTFLLQHALQGWCPPISVLRRLGVRTAEEINQERYALKALRGDFPKTTPAPGPAKAAQTREVIEAVQR